MSKWDSISTGLINFVGEVRELADRLEQAAKDERDRAFDALEQVGAERERFRNALAQIAALQPVHPDKDGLVRTEAMYAHALGRWNAAEIARAAIRGEKEQP